MGINRWSLKSNFVFRLVVDNSTGKSLEKRKTLENIICFSFDLQTLISNLIMSSPYNPTNGIKLNIPVHSLVNILIRPRFSRKKKLKLLCLKSIELEFFWAFTKELH